MTKFVLYFQKNKRKGKQNHVFGKSLSRLIDDTAVNFSQFHAVHISARKTTVLVVGARCSRKSAPQEVKLTLKSHKPDTIIHVYNTKFSLGKNNSSSNFNKITIQTKSKF